MIKVETVIKILNILQMVKIRNAFSNANHSGIKSFIRLTFCVFKELPW